MRLLLLAIFLSSSQAWLLPERCKQNPKTLTSTKNVLLNASRDPDIQDVANAQHSSVLKQYKDHKFIGVLVGNESCSYAPVTIVRTRFGGYNCTFHTYDPTPLSSVACDSSVCKLVHTVSTQSSYTASEGYNWGVKFTAKSSYFKIFEIGGELSTGGSYSCSYTKGKIVTDTVECTGPVGVSGQLQLYSVKTDMLCDFGPVSSARDIRNGTAVAISLGFTDEEKDDIKKASVQSKCLSNSSYIVDLDKISDKLLRRLKEEFPNYIPYTDVLQIDNFKLVSVLYYKGDGKEPQGKKVIPFTNESGNSVYSYACMFTPY